MKKIKKWMVLGLLIAMTGSGCMSWKTYKITLSNGQEILSTSRPKLDEDGFNYVWKGPNGEKQSMSRMRVRSIEVQ